MPGQKAVAADAGAGSAGAGAHGTRLVIVESPAKAKTIAGYLGSGYVVESSIGHIRGLPENAAEIPEKYKKERWAHLGVNVDADFEPVYVVHADKKAQVSKLKKLLEQADELYLATDEDREGEAIAWHLQEILKPKVPVHRMVFHEITADAIRRAVASPRELNNRLVDAQETRRILDRLYGFEVSSVLWKKVMPRLSAGRVQSVATRLVVERERERIAFVPAGYHGIEAELDTGRGDGENPGQFTATLLSVDGRRLAVGRDFAPDGTLKSAELLHLDEATSTALAGRLTGVPYQVRSVESKPYKRSPYAPFRTTTLQQEASRKLGFSSSYTMGLAQRLYENGYITYMRTDSITLSDSAVAAARTQAAELYGPQYVPDAPRRFQNKVKNAQEAHEAIRPAGEHFRTPAATGLRGDELRLYELVWKRTIASQMKDAAGQSVSVRVAARSTSGEDAEFGASGRVLTFHGFLKAYVESGDDPEGERDDQQRRLPALAEGQALTATRLLAEGHSTRPPARYTEASLVEELEKREIGRPSTYTTIMGTIQDRGYVIKKGTALVPSFRAFAVISLLEQHFGNLVDYEFTARMEECLDAIARGETERVPWLSRFYFGAEGEEGLEALVSDLGRIDARQVSSFPLPGGDLVVRVGKYGPYLERLSDEKRVNIPEGLAPDELDVARAEELLEQPTGDRELGLDPVGGLPLVARSGRYGPYVTEVLPEDAPKSARPRTASLFKTMDLDTVDLEQALRLLSLPRTLGDLDGEPVTAQNGRYGPYLKRGTDSRSLESEEQLFTVTLEQAKEIYAQPKRRGRAAAAPPLRELGPDPASGRPILVKEGRFGAYVTDGETNATLRKGETVESLTLQRGVELLAERRAKAQTSPKKAAAKKTAAKKTTTAKSAAAKTTTKKAAAKKTTTAKKAAASE